MGWKQARHLAWVLCAGIVASCTCGKPEPEGTGGSGPLAEDEVQTDQGRVVLEITEAFVKNGGEPSQRTSFLSPGEEIAVKARLTGAPRGMEDRILWTVTPVGTHTGPAVPATHEGKEFTFKGSSAHSRDGNRKPNPPLEYEVLATVTVDGQKMEARLPPTTFIRQDELDILRQEYADFGTSFQPTLANVSVAGRVRLNTGNYTVIVEETAGGLDKLLREVETEVNRILNDDVQERRVGTAGLRPNQVVVSPGAALPNVGPLGDTEPQGDDVCAGRRVNGGCAGPIHAGPNGIAETRANNRGTRIALEPFVTSAFRNPQRNRAIGSLALNSRHTRGRALDIDPRPMKVPGKDARQLMCVIEVAGARWVGESNSFTERGAATFLDCNDPVADHVHIQR
ncbi:MAG TPA: D-Ala-D-Ala carboxypeptidase family metallohydrolase [Myxococcaceae bacterium]